jgi:hypothetical protein
VPVTVIGVLRKFLVSTNRQLHFLLITELGAKCHERSRTLRGGSPEKAACRGIREGGGDLELSLEGQ